MAEKKNETLKKAREETNYLTGDAAIKILAELREKWDIDYESKKCTNMEIFQIDIE